MDTLYVVIPAYNEKENIEACITDWYEVVSRHSAEGKSRLVVIDDGSKDNTYEIMKAYAEDKPLMVALTKENGGHGDTVLFGYRYAIENHADYIFQTDSDGQTSPEEFEQFWEMREEYDAVIGERPVRGDGAGRKFVEDVVCLLLRIIFGVSTKDANAPFRLMKREKLQKYVEKLPKDFYIPNIMLTTYYLYYKDTLKFVDITFKPREKGNNSINVKKIIKIGIKSVFEFGKLKKEM